MSKLQPTAGKIIALQYMVTHVYHKIGLKTIKKRCALDRFFLLTSFIPHLHNASLVSDALTQFILNIKPYCHVHRNYGAHAIYIVQ
jgi:hypothetical protein